MTHATYIIAEAGVNHNGDRDMAFGLVDAAADAGADAVKFQTFNADKLATQSVAKAAYQKQQTDAAESQHAMLKKLELPHAWHRDLQAYAKKRGIEFLSTAFDEDSLAFLVTLDIPLFKIPSGELTNSPLLWKFARTGKPLILSTGMALLDEVEEALAVIGHGMHFDTEPRILHDALDHWQHPDCRRAVASRVSLLHCTSQYPAPLEAINLRAMDTLANAFGLPVGYSDHTQGTLIAVAAVARGATIIEKHFTLDNTLPGPDHKASLEPAELMHMVAQIRDLEKALGDGKKIPQTCELDIRTAARQQVIAARDITAGATLERQDLTTARCGHGLAPHNVWSLVGTSAKKSYHAGEPIE
jgi:N-acetylneuraminate synthase